MSEQRPVDEALRNAAEEWRITFDSIADPISIHSNDFRIIRLNKAFARTYGDGNVSSCLGRRCYEVVHGSSAPPADCPHRRVMATRQAMETEHFDVERGRHIEVSMSPVLNDSGNIMGVVQVIKDISERKQMEENLIVTDRLVSLGEMASGLAHEVNNPLTGIMGFTQLLLTDPRMPEALKGDLELVNGEARRAAEIVRKLLNFARGGAKSVEPVDVNEVLLNVVRLREYELRIKNIEVEKRLTLALPAVKADQMELQQVFINLIINAEYFMYRDHHGGNLRLETRDNNGWVRVVVADDGPGIPEDKLTHIFTPFITTKEIGQGTGLGLSICRGIINRFGGRIRAENNENGGARFVVDLPAV
jgi:PAS domain S-box-containing protein